MGECQKESSGDASARSRRSARCSLPFSRRSTPSMTDSKKPWPVMISYETTSAECEQKYWVWRPYSDQPRCALLHGAACEKKHCPRRL